MGLDATKICSGLYQGSAPGSASLVLGHGFSTVVFAAYEVQPPDHVLMGLEAFRCPLTDDYERPVTEVEWTAVSGCAGAVARRLRAGRRVLVTCAQGRNRSGLISARSMTLLGWSAKDAVRHIQSVRRFALTNPRFVEALLSRAP